MVMGGAPGPVTTTSFTFVRVGCENATNFSRSGVTVTMAATMSILPAVRAGYSWSLGSGTITTCTLRVPVFRSTFRSFSNSFNDS